MNSQMKRDRRGQMHTEGVIEMEGAYSMWMGQDVILRLAVDEMPVPLRGKLVGETPDALRLRIAGSWDVEIFKSMVLAIAPERIVQHLAI